MSAVPAAMAPLQPGARKVQCSEGGTIDREGKERRADVVKIPREGQRFGIERPAGTILRLENQNAPTMPCQLCCRHEPVGPSANNDGV
jgi:hypothetical protein